MVRYQLQVYLWDGLGNVALALALTVLGLGLGLEWSGLVNITGDSSSHKNSYIIA